jgi:hypothetical protein
MASRGKKILIGIGIGCLSLVLLAVASCTGFFIWLNQPGELLDADRLVGDDTTGYLAWTLRLEDPGTREFVQSTLESLQQLSRENRVRIHPALDSWLSRLQERRNERQIRQMFPLTVAWAQHPGTGPEDDLHLFSVSLQQAGNQLVFWDWVMGLFLSRAPEIEMVRHHGEKIFLLPQRGGEPLGFFIRGNDLFLTTGLETAMLAVDRLSRPRDEQRSPTGLGELLATVPEDSPLRGAITNRNGELMRVWDQLDPGSGSPELWRGIHGVTFSGGLVDGETLRIEAAFRCAGASQAAAGSGEVERVLRSLLEPVGVPLELRTKVDGEWVRVDVELRELTTSLGNALRVGTRGR